MEYSNLFLLSFVSENLKKIIESSQITRFKTIKIVYDDFGGDPPCVYIPNRYQGNMILKFADYPVRNLNKCFRLNLNGTMIDFGFFICPLAYGHPSEPVIESIHNYFLDLFGSSVEYRCITRDKLEGFLSRPRWFFTPLQNLSAIIISCNGYKEDMKELWNNLSLSPVFKHIDLSFLCPSVEDQDGLLIPRNEFTSQSEKLFSPECKIYQTESIEISQFLISTPAVLSHFQGKQAIIKCVKFKSSYLIEFVNKWKSGEAFQKLEYLKIQKVGGNGTDFPQVLDKIGAKYIDASKTPPTHTLPKLHIKFHGAKLNTPPIMSYAYVVRESDNRVASVLIQGRKFKFGVWDKTEGEFLRMLE
ncbi:hypothetical protein B9Z55_020706 [Caenorhabditis nigoni]|uniref:F-box associated domain-containing protein n=1 Tax=Caenorhabditis nigoni TaxID=1611254 RepID=A0A2G5TNR6_9PELO|nr:hypothetical protein B9Z55_020706 [Caenorhabditis nigoni]